MFTGFWVFEVICTGASKFYITVLNSLEDFVELSIFFEVLYKLITLSKNTRVLYILSVVELTISKFRTVFDDNEQMLTGHF